MTNWFPLRWNPSEWHPPSGDLLTKRATATIGLDRAGKWLNTNIRGSYTRDGPWRSVGTTQEVIAVEWIHEIHLQAVLPSTCLIVLVPARCIPRSSSSRRKTLAGSRPGGLKLVCRSSRQQTRSLFKYYSHKSWHPASRLPRLWDTIATNRFGK